MWDTYLKGFESYLLLEKSYSKNTQEAYLRDCKRLIDYCQESYPNLLLKELKFSHINKFLTSLQKPKEEKIIRISSVKRIVSGIRAFYKYLIIENIAETDPTELIDLPRLDERLPVVLTNLEIINLIDSIDKSTYRGEWINLAIEVMYGSGLRVSELINLRISNIFFKQEIIKVIGKGDKERWIPLNKLALKKIKLFVRNTRSKIKPKLGCEDVLFLNQRGGKLSRIAVFQAVKEIAERANIKKNIHPHTFRHSFATELIIGGADIMVVRELMGHANVSSTQIYTHLDTEELRETIILYHPLYNKKIKERE